MITSTTNKSSTKMIEEAKLKLLSQPNSVEAYKELVELYEQQQRYDRALYYRSKLAALMSQSAKWLNYQWGVLALKVTQALKYTQENKSLVDYQQYYPQTISQIGQDYWIINEVFNRKQNGYFLEIGSHDGFTINNTYLLEKVYGWTGICVEANPIIFKKLNKNRSAICLNSCIYEDYGQLEFIADNLMGGVLDQGADNEKRLEIDKKLLDKKIVVDTIPLVDVLKKHKAPKVIDYFSIDVEGAEEKILKGFPFDDYIFNCLSIERPTKYLQDLLIDNGYLVVRVIPGLDTFFIHRSFRQKYQDNLKNYYISKNKILYEMIETKSNIKALFEEI